MYVISPTQIRVTSLHWQSTQYIYQHRDGSEFLHREKLSFHLLLPSSSGQISRLQDAYEVYLLSIPDLCFSAT